MYIYLFQCSRSVSVIQRSGSRCGSSHHQAKIVRKPLISTVLWLLYDLLSVKNNVNVPQKRLFSFHFEGHCQKQQDPDPDPLVRYGSEDPDPKQNVTNPENWFNYWSPSLHSAKNTNEIFGTELFFVFFFLSAIIELDRKPKKDYRGTF